MRNVTRILLLLMIPFSFLISLQGISMKADNQGDFLYVSENNHGDRASIASHSNSLSNNNLRNKRADSVIINDYSEVLLMDVCTNLLQLDNPQPFKVGDTVLLIQ